MTIIDDGNRVEIQRKYIDYLITHMDFIEVRKELWHYLNKEKDKYSNYSLELEISRDAPEVLTCELSDILHTGVFQNA